MSTNYHTDIAVGAAANASVFNAPLGQLDAHLDDAMTLAVNNNAELAAARYPYDSLDARLDALVVAGGNIATKTNGVSAAGQKIITVDSTTGFIVGSYVTYYLNGTTLEGNVIGSIQDGVSLTMVSNVGAAPAGGVLDDTYISMISLSEYLAAQAIPHAGTLLLPDTMEYANAGHFNVHAYGASPSASAAANTIAFQAAIDAAKAVGGIVDIPPGTYEYDGALDLCDCHGVTLQGGSAGYPGISGVGTILICRNTNGVAVEIIGSADITLSNLQIIGHATDTPKVGIWTARSTAPQGVNANQIRIHRVFVYGSFSVAMVLNTGCESVNLDHCFIYPASEDCVAGWMFDWQNTLQLTPEHATLLLTYSSTLCTATYSHIISGGVTFTNYSPIYVVAEDGPSLRFSYLAAYGAPSIYLKGGSTSISIDAENTFSEGNPTYLVHCDYWDGDSGTYATYNYFRLRLVTFGGSAGSTGYSVWADGGSDDDTLMRDCYIENCAFLGNLRFYNVDGSRFLRWGLVSGSINPTLTVAGYAINSYFHVHYQDAISFASNLVNVTVDHESAASSPGAGYLLLAGNKGLAIGGAPEAANQGVIRRIYHESEAWSPGEIADGAIAYNRVLLNGVTADGKSFCMASYTGIIGEQGWLLSAYAKVDEINVTLLNKTGGALTPTGTLYVTAWQIEGT